MTQERSRRLAAVWFADIVGYTALSQRDESLALRVVAELQRTARQQCEARAGRVVKSIGDAVLAAFESADRAVQAALSTRDLFLRSEEVRESGVSLRIGLHVGEVAESHDGDVYGDAVNLASRIEPLAAPGQLVISDVAMRLLQQRSTIRTDDLGEHELKGVDHPVRVFAVTSEMRSAASTLRAQLEEELSPLQLLDIGGMGGMGEIYLARDPALRRTLAVKVLRSELVVDADARARFSREARVIAALSHPNIISVYSVGELRDGTPYFVMDYVEGGSLEDRLSREGPLPMHECRRIVGEVASALATAHERGVIHRDVKPSNVLIELESGRVVVTDWGIAALDPAAELSPDARLTTAGVVIGSPQYMSPEQLAGDEVGAESDVYALGLLAYELLTGEGPFGTGSPRTLMVSHLRDEAPLLSKKRPDVDPELETVVGRCLSKEPGERPTALEVSRLDPAGGTSVEWPPPGVEHLQAEAYKAFWILGLPITIPIAALVCWSIVSSFLAPQWDEVLTAYQNPALFGALVFAAIGGAIAVFYAGKHAISLALQLRQASQLGYGLWDLFELMADRRRDAGALISGAREYAVLSPKQRMRLRRKRIVAGGVVLFGGVVAPLVLLVAMVTVSPQWWMIGIVGITIAILVRPLLEDPKQVAKARDRFQRSLRRADRRSLAGAWDRAVDASGVERHRNRRPGAALPASAVGLSAAGVLALAAIGLLTVGYLNAALRLQAIPIMEVPTQRLRGLEGAAHLRLAPDASVSASEAVELLRQIGAAESRAVPAAFTSSDYVVGAGVRLDGIMARALSETAEGEIAVLRWLAEDPRIPLMRRLARAPGIDWMFEIPPHTRLPGSVFLGEGRYDFLFDDLRPARSSMVGAAAYHAAVGDVAAAEETLVELASMGLVLAESTVLLPAVRGMEVVRIALTALRDLYTETERLDDAELVQGVLSASGRPESDELVGDTTVVVPRPSQSVSPQQEWLGLVALVSDSTAPRPARWAALYELNILGICADVVRRLSPAPDVGDLIEVQGSALARFPSDTVFVQALVEETERMRAILPDSLPRLRRTFSGPGDPWEELSWWSRTGLVALLRMGDVLGAPELGVCFAYTVTSAD